MALKLIIGDTSCGKSNLICERLALHSVQEPDKHFIAIVPEQATMLMQKRLMQKHPTKIITNIEIVNFGFLAKLVFKELGKTTADILDDTGKALILRKVLDDNRDSLIVYSKKTRMPGFVEEIKSIITELKQYAIDDNALFLMQEAAQEQNNRLLYAKLQDIRLIYRKFEEEIERKYMVAEELLTVFANCASQSALLKNAEIYLDGFTGFTPVQFRLLEQLIRTAANVTIAVTIPEEKTNGSCPEHDLFYLSNRTYNRLVQIAGEAGVKVETAVCRKEEADEKRTAKVFAAANSEQEVEFVTAQILQLVKCENYRFRDIAIVVSDMESYHRIIRKTFEEAGISYFLDHKRKLTENILAHYLISAIRLVAERFSPEAVFSYLKTGLTDLTMDEISKLENYCLEFGIKGVRIFREGFTRNRTHGNPWDLEEINTIREKVLESVDAYYGALSPSGNTAGDYRRALENLFVKNEIEKKIHALSKEFSEMDQLSLGKEYEQIYAQICELIEKIAHILGEEKLTANGYLDIVASGLEEIKVGIIPPSLDAVVVGDLTRTRLDGVKALFLIGANEGKIPKAQSGNTIFSQKEREFLKNKDFEIAPTILESMYTQRFYIYLLLAKPEEKIWITYAQIAGDGTGLLPSYIIADLEELPLPISVETESDLPQMTWKAKKLQELAQTIAEPDAELLNYFAKENPERIRQILSAAFFSNVQMPIDPKTAEALYGAVLKGSVSRYEKYAECPFKHFMQYGIKAEKRPEYEVRATDIGTIYHDSLEKYGNRIKDLGKSFRDLTDEESHQLIKECVEEAAASMDSDVLESNARNEYMKERILRVSEKTTDVLRAQVRDGKYEPEEFELEFKTDLSEAVKFNGKIDRVDLYDGDDVFVKIIDYKSGSKQFDVKDIYTGTQLQLVAYLNEALKVAKKKYPDKAVHPGGIYYYLIQDKYVNKEDEIPNKFRMSGITNCADEALAAIDTTVSETNPGKSTIVEIQYDGKGLSRYAKVANNTEFAHLLDYVNNKILDISENVKCGNVAIEPLYKSETNNACTYCDYKCVCKFDDNHYGTNWKEVPKDTDYERSVFGRVKGE